MSLNSVLNRGIDGLTVNMRGMAVAANNIANINTKGYARQQVIIGARQTAGRGDVNGGGAEIVGVTSVVSPFVEMQLFNAANSFGLYDGQRKAVSQLEEIYNDAQTNGVGKYINDFFNGFSELANSPTSTSVRQSVKEKGVLLADKFNSMYRQINTMRKDVSSEISTRLEKINALAEDIAQFNETIALNGGTDANLDIASQRTYALRQLSEEVNCSFYTLSNGIIEVQVAGGTSLVSGFHAGSLSASDDLSAGGQMTINATLPQGSGSVAITSRITGGRLGGNLVARNTTLNNQITSLDTLAYTIVSQVNSVHSAGYGLDDSTGNNFFQAMASSSGAAQTIAMDSAILNDVNKIAAAQQAPSVSGPGDERNARALAALATTNTMNSGSETFAQYFGGLVGSIGVSSESLQKSFDSQNTLVSQMEVQRESISGVNMDEEGADLIRFQKAFQGASKLLATVSDMMDALLRI